MDRGHDPAAAVGGVKPAFAYYGGKARLASSWIVPNLPPHRVYVEPFAGSAAVLLAKTPVAHEILNDLDGHVINFYRVLRTNPDDLAHAVSLTPYARDEYDAADVDEPGLDDLERARRWWVRSTQGFGQSATRQTGWSISTAQNTPRMHQLTRRIDRFAEIAERLRHVFIENVDALDVIARYGTDPDACLYVDPPYLRATRSAPTCYRHEFQEDHQHRALAEALHAAKAAVVLSGYPSALYDDDLYAAWHRTETEITLRAGNGRKSALRAAVEVLWSNRPFPTAPAGVQLSFAEAAS